MGVPSDGREKISRDIPGKTSNSGDNVLYPDTKQHHDDLSPTPAEEPDLTGPFLQVLAAWVLLFAQFKYQRDLRISQTPELSGRIPLSQLIFARFPVCDPSTLASANIGPGAEISPQVQASFESYCKTFIVSQLCLLVLYGANVISLFWTNAGEGPWKKRYLPWAFVLAPTGAFMSSIVYGLRDGASMYLNVLPVCLSVFMTGCLAHNAYTVERGRRGRSGME